MSKDAAERSRVDDRRSCTGVGSERGWTDLGGRFDRSLQRESVRFEDVYSLLASPSGWDLDPAYDPGDGLHPNKQGYKRMADSLFAPLRAGTGNQGTRSSRSESGSH